MKCKYCGGNLDLEHKFCPHCGRPNELAQQHVRDMEIFQGEFDRTQKDVYRQASRWPGIFVRGVILSVIIVLIAICVFITQNAWSFRREHMERYAVRHAEEFTAQLDDYLDRMDYRGFSGFMEYQNINIYDEPYSKYKCIKWPADQYGRILDNVMRIVMPAPYDRNERFYEYLADDLNQFFQYTDSSYYNEFDQVDEAFARPHWERMEQTILDVLETYLNFSEEEAEALRAMSNPRRAVLLEEKIEAIKNGQAE